MGYLADIVKQLNESQDIIFVGTGLLVIDKQNRVLIGKRTDNDEWSLPGGSLEVGESLRHCGARELQEETGIVAKEEDLNLNWVEAILEPIIKNGRKIFIVSVSFWIKNYNDIDLDLDSRQFTRYGWFTPSEILKLDKITAYSKVALKQFYGGQLDALD